MAKPIKARKRRLMLVLILTFLSTMSSLSLNVGCAIKAKSAAYHIMPNIMRFYKLEIAGLNLSAFKKVFLLINDKNLF